MIVSLVNGDVRFFASLRMTCREYALIASLENGDHPMIVQPRLASAVMLLQDRPSGGGIEVFMVRRVIQSDFMPNVYVFPGGSVSKDDYATEVVGGVCAPVVTSPADPEGHTMAGNGVRAHRANGCRGAVSGVRQHSGADPLDLPLEGRHRDGRRNRGHLQNGRRPDGGADRPDRRSAQL